MRVATGDRGQRYEIRVTDGQGKELVVGWTDDLERAERLKDGIARHPVLTDPRIIDRRKDGGGKEWESS